MNENLIKVEGHPGYYRDMKTGAIVNMNKSALEAAKAQKEKRSKDEQEIQELKNDVKEMKQLLKELINSKV
jgi:hypothetical protein